MSTIAAGLTSTNALVSTGDTSGQLVFQTNGTTTAMTIDTSQNVGIGTTSPSSKLQCTGVVASGGNGGVNGYFQLNRTDATNLGSIEWLTSGDEMRYSNRNGGFHSFYTSSTERMRIESNGNVLIGTTTAQGKFTVSGTTGNAIYMGMNSADGAGLYGYNLNNAGYFTLYSNGSNGSGVGGWANSTVLEAVPASTGGLVLSSYTGNMIFQVGARTERMRIDSSGNLLVGTTSQIGSGKLCIVSNAGISLKGDSGSSNSGDIIFWRGDNGARSWGIQTNKDNLFIADDNFSNYAYLSQNPTTWQFASDSRIKKNIQDLSYGLDAVMAIKPRSFDYIATNKHDIGFIAQELKDVIPEAVSGEEIPFDDADTPQERASKTLGVGKETLIPVLVKAIQEQQAIITDLKARIETLENK